MNIISSLNRIKLLLLADIMENKKILLYFSTIIVLITVGFLRIYGNNLAFLLIPYILGWLCTVFLISYHLSLKTNRNSTFFTLPANNIEKFLTCLIEIWIMGIISIALYYIAVILWNCIFFNQIQEQFFGNSSEFYHVAAKMKFHKGDFIMINLYTFGNTSLAIWAHANLIWAFYILGIFTFSKNPVLKTLCTLGAVLFILNYTSAEFLSYFLTDKLYFNDFFYQKQYPGIFSIIQKYFSLILTVITLCVTYITYLKFTEKEVR